MEIEIIPLNKNLVTEVSNLFLGYLNSDSNVVATIQELEKSEQSLKRLLHYGLANCYLAKIRQSFVGFIVLSFSFSISKGEPILHIDALYSLPKYRNKGIGRRLMEYATELAIERKVCRLQLETDDENIPARNLYANLGFQKIEGKNVYMLFF
jgi:ribosomal protein S18 acetylase RimI-like enzyme